MIFLQNGYRYISLLHHEPLLYWKTVIIHFAQLSKINLMRIQAITAKSFLKAL